MVQKRIDGGVHEFFETIQRESFASTLLCYIHYVKMSVFVVFLVRIFPPLDRIRRDTPYLFVFSLNAGK